MPSTDKYFSGQGTVYIADRDNSGNILAFRDLGNVPKLSIEFSTDVTEHKESRSGQRLLDFRLPKENKAKVKLTLENFTKKNLMLLLYGTNTTKAGTGVTNEVMPSGLAVGDIYFVKYPVALTSVTVTDSAGSPATLVNNTDYSVDATTGAITIKNLGSYVQPFKANYTYGAAELVQFFQAANKERALHFVGLNTADTNTKVTIDLYRIVFDPVGNLDLINDDIAQFELEGSALYDSTRASDADLGGFGRILSNSSL